MIHIQIARNNQKILDEVESRLSSDPPAEPEWKELCVKLYSAYYNFDEKPKKFIRKYQKIEKKLLSHQTTEGLVLVDRKVYLQAEQEGRRLRHLLSGAVRYSSSTALHRGEDGRRKVGGTPSEWTPGSVQRSMARRLRVPRFSAHRTREGPGDEGTLPMGRSEPEALGLARSRCGTRRQNLRHPDREVPGKRRPQSMVRPCSHGTTTSGERVAVLWPSRVRRQIQEFLRPTLRRLLPGERKP